MYQIQLRLILLIIIAQLGLKLSDFIYCDSPQCHKRVGIAVNKVLQINWKPISIWPDEAKRFKN